MINALISLLTIFSFIMMVSFCASFVLSDYLLVHFFMFLLFCATSFGLLFLAEKRRKTKNHGQAIFNKVLFGIIGAAAYGSSIVYIFNSYGRICTIIYFGVTTTAMFELHRRFMSAKNQMRPKQSVNSDE